MKLSLLHSLLPNWGRHSGYSPLLYYLNNDKFRQTIYTTPHGNNLFPIGYWRLKRFALKRVRRNHRPVYCLNNLVTEWRLLADQVRERADIIHYLDAERNMQYSPRFLKIIRGRGKKPKLIATFHHAPEVQGDYINDGVIKLVDHAIVFGPSLADYFRRFLPADRITAIPLGIDTDFFAPAEKKPGGKTVCLAVGNFLRDHDSFLQVAEKFRDDRSLEFHLLTGKRPARLPRNVRHHARLSDEQLLALYRRADIFMLPLQNASANGALLEAMACGLPVITTELPAVREIVAGTGTTLVKRGDVAAYAEALDHLRKNGRLRRSLGQRARQKALTYAWPAMARLHEKLYLRVEQQ